MPDNEKDDKEIQIRLKTQLKEFSVEDSPFSVPATIDALGLNTLVKGLLSHCYNVPEFDWLCCNDLLRGKLSDHLSEREEWSPEVVVDLEFVDKSCAPKPEASLNHDDWVSACRILGDVVLSGCYDNTVNIFGIQGDKKLVIPGHGGPVKSVDWIEVTEKGGSFVSASHDQNIHIYTWNRHSNSIENLNCCKGHERSVECVAVSPNRQLFVSGSFDNTVKVWGANAATQDDVQGESEAKRSRSGSSKAVTRTPIQTLGGHKEAVGGVTWTSNSEIVSASWDHTIKIWDTELGGLKSELVTNKALFAVAAGGENGGLLLAAGAERSVRLYDPRAGTDVKAAYTAHTGWVTAVSWSPDTALQFASSSHDQTVRMWDTRSCRTPLYELTGHTDKVLSCHWAAGRLVSGGADNQLKIYNTGELAAS